MRPPARRCPGSGPARRSDTTHGIRLFFLERSKERPLSVRTAAGVDHRDGSCGGLDAGPRAGRRAVWRAARPRHGARSFASRVGPADVLPLRRPHRRGLAPAGQAVRTARTTGCEACAGASPTSTPRRRGSRPAGVDVSEVRAGRKPGTRVMTVRNGTCGVPTLLVQPSATQRLKRLEASFLMTAPRVLHLTGSRAIIERVIWPRQSEF